MKNFSRILKAAWQSLRRLALVVGLPLILVLLALKVYVAVTTGRYCYDQIAKVPFHRVGLVFGAAVRPGGRLSPMLADRVNAAIELYRAGRIHKLLMSGDNSQVNYDEVSAMRQYALDQGIPAEDISLDYAGFSTYESCYRARAIFGVRDVVLVTQQFHLARAVYTCQELGVEAVGYSVRDWGVYSNRVLSFYTLRETLATIKALWQVHITRPLPTFLGPVEVID
jgi:vancomycin permeability regulator SanA